MNCKSISGEIDERVPNPVDMDPILKMTYYSLTDYDMILWSGNLDKTGMQLLRFVDNVQVDTLHFHG